MNASMLALIVFCIAAEIARELCFKRAVDADEAKPEETGFLRMFFAAPLLWLGIAFWGAELVAWVVVLEHVRLNVAFPLMSLTYCGVPLASRWLLHERMEKRQWFAMSMITFGAALVGYTGI